VTVAPHSHGIDSPACPVSTANCRPQAQVTRYFAIALAPQSRHPPNSQHYKVKFKTTAAALDCRIRHKALFYNNIRQSRRARAVAPPYHRSRTRVSWQVAPHARIVMFFRFVPMDRVFRLLTIERLELPAAGGLDWVGKPAAKGCVRQQGLWPGGWHTLSGFVVDLATDVATHAGSTACTSHRHQFSPDRSEIQTGWVTTCRWRPFIKNSFRRTPTRTGCYVASPLQQDAPSGHEVLSHRQGRSHCQGNVPLSARDA
jgi:hypothetical protein